MAHIIHTMGACCCTTKFQWHHEHFRLFEFEVWVLASYCNRSLFCSCFFHELRWGSRSFPTPDDNFIPDMKRPTVSIKPKESKVMFC